MDAAEKKIIASAILSLSRREPIEPAPRAELNLWAHGYSTAPTPEAIEDGKDRAIRNLTSQVMDLKQQLAGVPEAAPIVFDIARPRDIRPILNGIKTHALLLYTNTSTLTLDSRARLAATEIWNLVQELFAAMPAEVLSDKQILARGIASLAQEGLAAMTAQESLPDSMGGVHIAGPNLHDPIAGAPKRTPTAEEAHATLAVQMTEAIRVQILFPDVSSARFDRIVCEPHFRVDAEPTHKALILEFLSSEPDSRRLIQERVTYRAYFARPGGPIERLKNEEFSVIERGAWIGIAKAVAPPVRP